MVNLNNFERIARCFAGNVSFQGVPYQLLTVAKTPTVVLTGNRELGLDSREGAWETFTTSKEGSRHANYPLAEGRGSGKKKKKAISLILQYEIL